MYNQYDDSHDMDDDIEVRKGLIEEIKKLDLEGDIREVGNKINDLKKRWKRIPYTESAYEDELMEEFEKYLDVYYGKRNQGFKNSSEYKQNLIQQAKELLESDNIRNANEKLNDLMAQWKTASSAGKEEDDQLWDAFNTIRQSFFERKQQHWEDMQKKFVHAREVKQELIQQAKALCDSSDWKKTSDIHRILMDSWKEVGSASKEFDDQLWNEFNEYRQRFYERRSAYYEEMRSVLDEKFNSKKALIEKAKSIMGEAGFTKENTSEMKSLSEEWKKIGSCGQEREDSVWKEFRSIMDAYFEGLKKFNEQKHADWRANMQDIRTRKSELIMEQKRQIKWMQNEIIGLIGERAIEEMQEDIKDKEAFISELEEQITDIDKKLVE